MAYTYPVPLSGFFSKLPIQNASLELGEAYEMNETGFGELLTASLGSRLWKMDISLRGGSYNEMEELRSKVNLLRQPGKTFLIHSIPGAYPRHDPTGSILGANQVTINSVRANQIELNFTGLPVGYRLYEGDYFSFEYGTNPVRYAFHQMVLSNTSNNFVNANASGTTQFMEVTPALRPGFAVGANVTIIKPVFKALIVPGTGKLGKTGGRETSGISFSAIQTLRN